MSSDRMPGGFNVLQRFLRKREAVEHCDFCSAPLNPQHQHLIDPGQKKLVCACDACAILFSSQGETKYQRIPRQVRFLKDFQLPDLLWDRLAIPIQLAFFVNSSPLQKVMAFYPSPAGPIESTLELACWEEIAKQNPVLEHMQADVEGLLAYRVASPAEYYLAPIDECFKLSGLLRTHWQGLSGGTELWKQIRGFFEDLKERAG